MPAEGGTGHTVTAVARLAREPVPGLGPGPLAGRPWRDKNNSTLYREGHSLMKAVAWRALHTKNTKGGPTRHTTCHVRKVGWGRGRAASGAAKMRTSHGFVLDKQDRAWGATQHTGCQRARPHSGTCGNLTPRAFPRWAATLTAAARRLR